MTDNQDKELCPLYFPGGRCPICDDEWCDLGISYEKGQRINKECCAAHRDPTDEELREMFGEEKRT